MHTTFALTRDELKQQIVVNVEGQYINTLKKNINIYATVTLLEIPTHLWDYYGNIGLNEITENEKRMKALMMVTVHQNHHQSYHPTSDVTLWTDPSTNSLKIFTSSHDGHWRLYNTSSNNSNTTNSNSTLNIQINKEFEHAMGGPIDIITVASGYLFCGFSGPSIRIPGDTNDGGRVGFGGLHATSHNNTVIFPPKQTKKFQLTEGYGYFHNDPWRIHRITLGVFRTCESLS